MKYKVVQCYALYLAILFHSASRCEDSFDFEHGATHTGARTLEDHHRARARHRRRFHLFFFSDADAAASD